MKKIISFIIMLILLTNISAKTNNYSALYSKDSIVADSVWNRFRFRWDSMSRIINPDIKFKDTIIENRRIDTSFTKIVYEGNFRYSRFDNPLYLCCTKFETNMDFQGAEFNSIINFKYSLFASTADFQYANINSLVSFERAVFNHRLLAAHINVFSDISFNGVTFKSDVDFRSAALNDNISFYSTKFGSKVDFEGSKINSSIIFDGANFYTILNFKKSEIEDANLISFNYTKLPRELNLLEVRIKTGKLNFMNTNNRNNNSKCILYIDPTNAEKVIIPYDRFKLDVENMLINERTSLYIGLLKSLEEEGYMHSYEQFDKEYKEFKLKNKGLFSYISCLVQKYWWDFGYNKERVFLWAICFLILFSIINTLVFSRFTNDTYDFSDKRNTKELVIKTDLLTRFGFALFYTSTIFFGLKFTIEKLNFKKLLNGNWKDKFWLSYFFLIYIIGLVCIGFIANLVISI